ncbi:hypothetical protein [Massilia rubra]|uniref:Uncharacterized protein n=1 Tax=Massilia rubra TaxID=2607910 RepID=A0ABX0LT43_9BURK|nr:hypothetical protein [Massilia rubra]NHZ35357.1 hypothetical protein [Massilia rubra]
MGASLFALAEAGRAERVVSLDPKSGAWLAGRKSCRKIRINTANTATSAFIETGYTAVTWRDNVSQKTKSPTQWLGYVLDFKRKRWGG